jgi:transcriptional regulator with XRE-family HTH domain
MKANILAEYMESKGLSQADITRKTGLPQSTISRHINGKKRPSAHAINLYARVLRIPMGQLIAWASGTDEAA